MIIDQVCMARQWDANGHANGTPISRQRHANVTPTGTPMGRQWHANGHANGTPTAGVGGQWRGWDETTTATRPPTADPTFNHNTSTTLPQHYLYLQTFPHPYPNLSKTLP